MLHMLEYFKNTGLDNTLHIGILYIHYILLQEISISKLCSVSHWLIVKKNANLYTSIDI